MNVFHTHLIESIIGSKIITQTHPSVQLTTVPTAVERSLCAMCLVARLYMRQYDVRHSFGSNVSHVFWLISSFHIFLCLPFFVGNFPFYFVVYSLAVLLYRMDEQNRTCRLVRDSKKSQYFQFFFWCRILR